MTPSPIFAIALGLIVVLAVPALGASPQGPAPGQVPDRPQMQQVDPERLSCDPDDPRCRSNPCAGATEIYGYDTATCTPCLPNSVAALSNRVCTCIDGYVETSRDSWGRATCVAAQDAAEDPPQATALVDVTVNAVAFLSANQEVGHSFSTGQQPAGFSCLITPYGANMVLEALPPLTAAVMPTPYPESNYTCRFTLFGAQLQNGWQITGLADIDDSDCPPDPDDYGYSVTKRTADPADSTFDVAIKAWGQTFCQIRIGSVRLRGPSNQSWSSAF